MDHQNKIEILSRHIVSGSGNFSLKHSTSNTLRNSLHNKSTVKLDLANLNEVLSFDPEEPSITVEPRITFRALCRYTLKRGFVPPVVPEFATITVGGAIMGGALESSSHRFGQVSDTALEYELILGDGQIVKASKSERPDLFYGISGSYGSLALLVAVKLRLLPAKKYVRLTHHQFSSPAQIIPFLTQNRSEMFVEGIVLNPNHAVAITGEMADAPASPLIRQKRPWAKWYLQELERPTCSMLLDEYLFRLDRGAFWMGLYVNAIPKMCRLLFNYKPQKIQLRKGPYPSPLFRLLFGWALSSERLYKVWHRVPNEVAANLFFVHDFYTPVERAQEVLAHFEKETAIYPIWLCPLKGTDTPQLASPHFGGERFLNIGLYGIPHSPLSIPELTATLEKEIVSYGGKKMLYSFTYYTEEELIKIYNGGRLEELRQKFSAANTFPSLYNKVKMC